jgi:hypothetical protein
MYLITNFVLQNRNWNMKNISLNLNQITATTQTYKFVYIRYMSSKVTDPVEYIQAYVPKCITAFKIL